MRNLVLFFAENSEQNIGLIIFLAVIAVLALIALFKSIVVVRQTEAYIVERVGKYRGTLDVGLHLILPFFYNKI